MDLNQLFREVLLGSSPKRLLEQVLESEDAREDGVSGALERLLASYPDLEEQDCAALDQELGEYWAEHQDFSSTLNRLIRSPLSPKLRGLVQSAAEMAGVKLIRPR